MLGLPEPSLVYDFVVNLVPAWALGVYLVMPIPGASTAIADAHMAGGNVEMATPAH